MWTMIYVSHSTTAELFHLFSALISRFAIFVMQSKRYEVAHTEASHLNQFYIDTTPKII